MKTNFFNAAISSAICLFVFASQADAQSTQLRDVGAHVPGTYNAVGDKVILIATEWRGTFSAPIAGNVFRQAVAQRKRQGDTAAQAAQAKKMGARADGCQTRKLAPDRHMVIGWHNLDRNEYKWYAIKLTSPTSFRYIIPGNASSAQINGTGNDFKSPISMTNGQRIQTHFADDDNGGIFWRFEFLK